jgi:hypothetical protein
MLKSILKFLFPGTIASIVYEEIDNYWFDLEQANIISQYGSLANYQQHVDEFDKLQQELYEQEMRERMEMDENYYIDYSD